MNKFSLKTQLIVAFIFTFFLVGFLSRVFLYPEVRKPFDDGVYHQLSLDQDYVEYDKENNIIFPNNKTTAFIFIDAYGNVSSSDNLANMITNETQKSIVTKVTNNQTNQSFTLDENDNKIYVISRVQLNRSVLISLTTDSKLDDYNNNFPDRIALSAIATILLPLLVLFVWISIVVKRVNKLKNAVDNFENSKELNISVKGKDEISELTNSFINLKNRLDSEEKQKQEMFQHISHELKTPLTTIKSYAESIEDGVYPHGDLLGTTQVIIKQSERLMDRVNHIMNLNKVNYIIDKEAINNIILGNIISDIIPIYEIKAPRLSFVLDIDNSIFKGNIDSWQIVLENILDNSIRYARSTVSIKVGNDYLEIFNDGEHIEEEVLSSIFNLYIKGTNGSFGIGMSIVRNTVTTFGYDIKVQNVENGVLFKIFKAH